MLTNIMGSKRWGEPGCQADNWSVLPKIGLIFIFSMVVNDNNNPKSLLLKLLKKNNDVETEKALVSWYHSNFSEREPWIIAYFLRLREKQCV